MGSCCSSAEEPKQAPVLQESMPAIVVEPIHEGEQTSSSNSNNKNKNKENVSDQDETGEHHSTKLHDQKMKAYLKKQHIEGTPLRKHHGAKDFNEKAAEEEKREDVIPIALPPVVSKYKFFKSADKNLFASSEKNNNNKNNFLPRIEGGFDGAFVAACFEDGLLFRFAGPLAHDSDQENDPNSPNDNNNNNNNNQQNSSSSSSKPKRKHHHQHRHKKPIGSPIGDHDLQAWYFYNDTTDLKMRVEYSFGPCSEVKFGERVELLGVAGGNLGGSFASSVGAGGSLLSLDFGTSSTKNMLQHEMEPREANEINNNENGNENNNETAEKKNSEKPVLEEAPMEISVTIPDENFHFPTDEKEESSGKKDDKEENTSSASNNLLGATTKEETSGNSPLSSPGTLRRSDSLQWTTAILCLNPGECFKFVEGTPNGYRASFSSEEYKPGQQQGEIMGAKTESSPLSMKQGAEDEKLGEKNVDDASASSSQIQQQQQKIEEEKTIIIIENNKNNNLLVVPEKEKQQQEKQPQLLQENKREIAKELELMEDVLLASKNTNNNTNIAAAAEAPVNITDEEGNSHSISPARPISASSKKKSSSSSKQKQEEKSPRSFPGISYNNEDAFCLLSSVHEGGDELAAGICSRFDKIDAASLPNAPGEFRRACIERGVRFIDRDFPPSDESLFRPDVDDLCVPSMSWMRMNARTISNMKKIKSNSNETTTTDNQGREIKPASSPASSSKKKNRSQSQNNNNYNSVEQQQQQTQEENQQQQQQFTVGESVNPSDIEAGALGDVWVTSALIALTDACPWVIKDRMFGNLVIPVDVVQNNNNNKNMKEDQTPKKENANNNNNDNNNNIAAVTSPPPFENETGNVPENYHSSTSNVNNSMMNVSALTVDNNNNNNSTTNVSALTEANDSSSSQINNSSLQLSNSNLTISPTNGLIRVAINKAGWWRSVVVDDYLPIALGRPAFCRNNSSVAAVASTSISSSSSSSNNIVADPWPSFAQKALAKVHGSYAALVGGDIRDALQDFSGFPTTSLIEQWCEVTGTNVDNYSSSPARMRHSNNNNNEPTSSGNHNFSQKQILEKDRSLFDRLVQAIGQGHIVMLSTPTPDDDEAMTKHHLSSSSSSNSLDGSGDDLSSFYKRFGLTLGCSYLMKTVYVKRGVKLVQFRNTSGEFVSSNNSSGEQQKQKQKQNFSWTGDWSENSSCWDDNPEIATDLKTTSNNNGEIFWMSWQDCKKYFVDCCICYVQQQQQQQQKAQTGGNNSYEYRILGYWDENNSQRIPSCVLEVSTKEKENQEKRGEEPTILTTMLSQCDSRGLRTDHPASHGAAMLLSCFEDDSEEAGWYRLRGNTTQDIEEQSTSFPFAYCRDVAMSFPVEYDSSASRNEPFGESSSTKKSKNNITSSKKYFFVPRIHQQSRKIQTFFTISLFCSQPLSIKIHNVAGSASGNNDNAVNCEIFSNAKAIGHEDWEKAFSSSKNSSETGARFQMRVAGQDHIISGVANEI